MGQPPAKSVEDKNLIVLAVLCGENLIAATGRREGPSQASISKWRVLFLSGGQRALVARARRSPCSQEQQMAVETASSESLQSQQQQ
jgi:hypothetical protein